jgi:hypothetical protein
MDEGRKFINDIIYLACEGRASDIKALMDNSYIEFCSILDSYLEKVERTNKEIEKMKKGFDSSGIKKGKKS